MEERLDAIELPAGEEIRPRAMWCDDKNGGFVWYLDYLYDAPRFEDRERPLNLAFSADGLAERPGDGPSRTATANGTRSKLPRGL